MTVASLSFSAVLPTYTSLGKGSQLSPQTGLVTSGNVTLDTSSSSGTSLLGSSLTAGGISYTAQNFSVSGDKVTVFYNPLGAGAVNDTTAQEELNAANQDASVTGNVSIVPEGSQTVGDLTTTTFQLQTKGLATNTFGSTDSQYDTATSISNGTTVLSLQGIAASGDGLSVTYQLSSPQTSSAAAAAAPSNQSAGANNAGNTGFTPSAQGITTVGDLLASASGLSLNGTLTNALLSPSSGGSALAGVLNPGIDANPNAIPSIADFINTSPNAFPSAPTALPASSNDNFFSSDSNSNSNTPSAASTTNAAPSNSTDGSGIAASSFYSAIADASSSTIRGAGVNVVA